jgi:hypothetical protein
MKGTAPVAESAFVLSHPHKAEDRQDGIVKPLRALDVIRA